MEISNLTDVTLLENVINQFSSLITLFQAIGGLILFYIIINIIGMILNRKKSKQLAEINKNLKKIKRILQKK
ncbi:MAG: hypothetical protein KJ646_00055 [Nanoarchaeota archaeon]|nr:hypothetical protein [Nanoarchaeota archaeon]MBU4117119.1 hypothetical protein [Nanoarchaeota archaeon]MBU4339284.1 hypothetical protein [Patescibacteria group bacterium]